VFLLTVVAEPPHGDAQRRSTSYKKNAKPPTHQQAETASAKP